MDDAYFSFDTMTVADFKKKLETLNVPDDAVIDYEGCGSHTIEVRPAAYQGEGN